MKKSTAKRNFIALAVLALVLLFFAFGQFNVPFTHYTYNGFLGGIPLGYDLGEGLVAHYETGDNALYEGDKNYEARRKTVSNAFNDFLNESFSEFSINKTDTGFKVQIPNVADAANVLALLDGAGSIEFKSQDSTSAVAEVSGKHIKSATFANNGGTTGVLIQFTDKGGDLFYELTTAQAGNQIYVYIGGELFFQPTVSEGISGGYTFISGNMSSEFEAQAYAFKITASVHGVDIDLTQDPAVQPAKLGAQAPIYLAILGALVLVGAVVAISVRYKHLGLIGLLGLAYSFSMLLLALNIFNLIELTLASLLGILFAFLIMALNLVSYFERLHSEFRTGKKIPISTRLAGRNAVSLILDTNAPIFLATLLMAWLGKGVVTSFAIPVAIGTLLSTFFVLVVVRGLVKMYQFINITNHAKYGFDKSEVQHEEK